MRRYPPLLLILAVLALAACGGSNPKTFTVRAAPGPALVKPCNPGDYFMQCALPPAPRSLGAGGPARAYGIDFAWSCPSPAGHSFGASYLSTDASKNWTLHCVGAYHAAGAATVAVWETAATEATRGYNAGRSDAFAAAGQAAALGNTTRPIFFAIDCDCAGQTVAGYFDGVRSVLPRDRTGAYAGIRPITFLFDTGRIGYGWQTYAWSGGAWDARAQLEQYLNDSSVDYDRALAADYGQWPYAPTPVLPMCFTHRITKTQCVTAHAQITAARRGADSSFRAFLARGCDTLRAREHWFMQAIATQPRSPQLAHRKGALAATKRAELRQQCGLFTGRFDYFSRLANRIQVRS